MKAKYSILVLSVLLTLSACHTPTREARRMLARAERLADTQPDSTMRLVDSILRMEAYLSERERMDMALLQAEALFGGRDVSRNVSDDILDDFGDVSGNVSTSPELERAAAYYADKKQYSKAAHAALYSGFVQQHYNEKDAAMQSFKDAERYGDLAGDSLCMARAEYGMGKLLYYEGRKQEALAAFLVSRDYVGKRYADKATIENGIASVYILLKQYDSVEICLQRSLLYAQRSLSPKVKRKVLNNYAVLYRQQGQYDLSIEYLRQIADNTIIDDAHSFVHYLNMGKAFMAADMTDSTMLYFQHIEDLLPSINLTDETKISAYHALSQFAESQKNDSLALFYQKKLGNSLYKVMLQRQEQNTYRIQMKYNYESLQNEMNRKLARTRLIIVLSIVLLLSVIAVFLFRSSQRNKKEAEANANLFHFMQQNKALIESNMSQEKKILNTTQQMSDMMYDKFNSLLLLNYCLETPKDKGALKDLRKEAFGADDPWETIRGIISTLYPGLEETLRLKYPEMDELELRVCLLSRFRLSRRIEAALLGVSLSVLDKLRMKVRKMMEN